MRLIFLVFSFTAAAFAAPTKLRMPRSESYIKARQQVAILEPVSFQTVTTTQTNSGTITETCDVTLSPIDGSDNVKEDKSCTYDVVPNGGGDPGQEQAPPQESPPPPPPPQDENPPESSEAPEESPSAETPPESSPSEEVPPPTESPSASPTVPPIVSVIGPGTIPLSEAGTPSIPATETPPVPAPGTEPVTSFSTDASGSVSTVVTTPTPVSAEEQPQTANPGRKLEVLPIGLGVFAGISVIALIVVGLVTYERTKYRKAFRQRKLAQAGASMGYGGMAERT